MEFVDFNGGGGMEDSNELGRGEGRTFTHAANLQHAFLAHHSPGLFLPDSMAGGYFVADGSNQAACDIKPRLNKEQQDILEAHYTVQSKPNTTTKKAVAQSINVSLEKVNNWFQNRRAKSKQESKRAASSLDSLSHDPQSGIQAGFSSDSDASPSFPSQDYFNVMEQWTPDEQETSGLGISQTQDTQEQLHEHETAFPGDVDTGDNIPTLAVPQNGQDENLPSPDAMNRRTLTQDQFDAFTRNGGLMNSDRGLDDLGLALSVGQDYDQILSSSQILDFKQQGDHHAFTHNFGTPMSSYDSTIPSTVSDQSVPGFPQSSQIQEQAYGSAPSSHWGDSRSSSLSLADDSYLAHPGGMSHPSGQPFTSTAQWQPGQSVPVNPYVLNEQFRQIAQAAQMRHSPQQAQMNERALAWSSDDVFGRRGSQTSLLAQSMSNVGLHTPQPNQTASFKPPTPHSNIAARRQRPRPAALGLAALRSQSYSGAAAPSSAGPVVAPSNLAPSNLASGTPPLRRIRSSNVINGVAQGRVMKSVPGSAQRSPLNWNFAESVKSPKALRHVSQSQGSLAPPTPRSPADQTTEQLAPSPHWQLSAGQTGQHLSTGTLDLDPGALRQTSISVPPQPFRSSPPHSPHLKHDSFAQDQLESVSNLEDTPPLSAPATQQFFPANLWGSSQTHAQQLPTHPKPKHVVTSQSRASPPPQQQYMNVITPDPQFNATRVSFPPDYQITSSTIGPSPSVPIQFANGVPVVNANGNFQMDFPQPLQFVHPPQQQQPPASQRQNPTPPQLTFQFVSSEGNPPNPLVSSPFPRQMVPAASELLVHEYVPPDDMKRAASPRKGVPESGPKNYTFANQTPEHFSKDKGKKSDASKGAEATSASPAGSSNSGSSS